MTWTLRAGSLAAALLAGANSTGCTSPVDALPLLSVGSAAPWTTVELSTMIDIAGAVGPGRWDAFWGTAAGMPHLGFVNRDAGSAASAPVLDAGTAAYAGPAGGIWTARGFVHAIPAAPYTMTGTQLYLLRSDPEDAESLAVAVLDLPEAPTRAPTLATDGETVAIAISFGAGASARTEVALADSNLEVVQAFTATDLPSADDAVSWPLSTDGRDGVLAFADDQTTWFLDVETSVLTPVRIEGIDHVALTAVVATESGWLVVQGTPPDPEIYRDQVIESTLHVAEVSEPGSTTAATPVPATLGYLKNDIHRVSAISTPRGVSLFVEVDAATPQVDLFRLSPSGALAYPAGAVLPGGGDNYDVLLDAADDGDTVRLLRGC